MPDQRVKMPSADREATGCAVKDSNPGTADERHATSGVTGASDWFLLAG